MLGVPVSALGRGPADQRGVAEPADLIDLLGQLADQVPGGHPGQHGPLIRLGQPQQAKRGDRPVPQARPGRPQSPAPARPGLAGDGEHELAVVVLLGQAQLGDAEKPVQQGSVARGAIGQETETGVLQRHVRASVVKHPGAEGRLVPRTLNTCNPSLHEWISPPYTDALCEIRRSGSRRAQRAKLHVGRPAPGGHDGPRRFYGFVTFCLPALLAFAHGFPRS